MIRDTMLQTICYILVAMILSTVCAAEEWDNSNRSKRQASQPVGLFPFPRVGRSDPEQMWDNSISANSIEDYDDLGRREMIKRQGLVPFPRVGRAGKDNNAARWVNWAKAYNNQDAKRAELAGATSGLWFGPRLGRVQKREA